MKQNKLENTAEPRSFRQIRYDEKRVAIIKSAAKAFGRKGFFAATIEDIANELTMTKGSLYYYFSTKEELLFEVHQVSLHEVLINIRKIVASKALPDQKMRQAITKHLEVFAKEYEGAYLLQQEYNLPELYKKKIIALRDEYEKHLIGIVEEGVKAKLFSVKDTKITSFCILGAINWFLRWFSSSGKLTVDEIADIYSDFFLRGLLTRKAPK